MNPEFRKWYLGVARLTVTVVLGLLAMVIIWLFWSP
jgi:hypothetical protein